ncbi:unnamed protein product [Zymoseptoria tritici ST99CH_3D7]|uniref:Carrier domain-containing protein n=1 Tax=Zymoseptoria tritici (strain ST99CH_3D7) TaxID=1276538 RepID=A0A1X7RJK0_ZYMT9|nr:unnamed protein product [Zymoseptoria tritici ST99CH_3D7]
MAPHLSISNPNPRRLQGPSLLHELIPLESQHGSAAIEHTDADGNLTSLSYAEFHTKANALARRIISHLGHRRSDRLIIPLLIPQSPDLYISQLATLKAGGAFCPIVLDAPEERLRFILQDIDATILLTTADHKSKLLDLEGVRILAVDEHSPAADGDQTDLDVSVTPQDAAYIMYTSGSTGQPKGVVLSHSAATQALLAHDLHIPSFSRFLQFASPTFDVSVFEIFFPWFRSCTLVSCDRRRLLNDLPSAINNLKIDACELTPSVASSLLQGRESVPSLKVLLTIGEMLKPSVVEEFGGDDETPAILHGMYGPTEATIHCTLQTNFAKSMSCSSIGIPLDTVSAFVVRIPADDDVAPSNLEIMPLGEEGELAVGGHQLADGYLNRDEKTREVFVEHPDHGLLYRTGDRVRMLPDGKLECLGRISSGQVKLRGQRIELGEIEHAASKTPGCRDVAAEVISGILVIFCVRGTDSLTDSLILETCRKWLPEFMIPGNAVIIPSLPYLASGKCDRKTLRAEYEKSQEEGEGDDAVLDEQTEKTIAVLGEVLGQEVTASTTLPSIGVDSLSAIRLASALRKNGFPQLDAARILAARTPHDIVKALKRASAERATSGQTGEFDASYRARLDTAVEKALPSMQSDIETAFPCTPVQVAMLTETERDSQAYCNWIELFIPGEWSLPTISDALRKLSKAHPLLRSGFAPIDGTTWSFAVVVWKSLAPDQLRENADLRPSLRIGSSQDLLRPITFSSRLCDGGVRLLVELHHALFDQWAMDVFRSDLLAILHNRERQQPGSFKSVSDYYISYQDDTKSAAVIDFWQDHLRDVIPSPMPILRAESVPDSVQRTSWHDFTIITEDVRSKAAALGCSVPAVFQAAMAFLLGSYAGTTDVTLGSVFSGRTIPVADVDSVFGPCLATLPFRMDFSAVATCKDLLRAVTDRNRAMQNYVATSPTFIRRAAGIMPGTKLFDSLFIWQESTVTGGADEIQVLDSSEDRLEYGLILEFEPTPSNVKARATYKESLVGEDQIEMMLRQIESIAAYLIEQPTGLVDALGSCLSDETLSTYRRYGAIYDGAVEGPTATFVLSLDGDDRILSCGAFGEIAHSDEQNEKHDSNASRVINHPKHGRLYRSGETGRLLADGTLLIAGRVDDLVTFKGTQVDVAKISAAIAQHSGVVECATLLCGEQSSKPTLVSFWVPASQGRACTTTATVSKAEPQAISSIFEQLEDMLQDYMIPATLVPMSKLPETQEGKLDKQYLQSIFNGLGSEDRDHFSRPHNASGADEVISTQEQIVAECLAGYLEIPVANISRQSSFASLGMTSQHVPEVAKSLEKRLHARIDVTMITGDRTIAQLCRAITSTGDGLEGPDNTREPTSPEEQAVANALADMLDIPSTRISRTSSFLSLGLNSLNAIQLVRSLKKQLGVDVSVSTILSHPSITRLCRTLSDYLRAGEKQQAVNIREVISGDFTQEIEQSFVAEGHIVEAILPCTPLQQAMLSATSSADGGAYCDTLKLKPFADMQKFKDCWREMVKRHPILRTCFVETPLAAYPFAQVVLKDQPSSWVHFGNESNGSLINGHASGDLEGNISARVPLRFDAQGSDLYLRMHHALYDGVSVSILFSELTRLYNGEQLPSPVSFEPFLQVVLAQNGPHALKFWSTQMKDFTPQPFPKHAVDTQLQAEKTLGRKLSVRPAVLRAFGERHSCTTSIIFQAAWAKTLACLQAGTDVCFGNVVSGRTVTVPDVERLVAPCFNTVPLRTRMHELRTNMDLIAHLQRINVDTMPHQLTAVGKIQGLTLDPSRRLFESILLVQPPSIESNDVFTEEGEMDMGIPLVVEIIPGEEDFDLKVHFLIDRVAEAIIPSLMDAFEAALASCMRYSSSSLDQFVEFDSAQIAGKLRAPLAPSEVNGNDENLSNGDTAGSWSSAEQKIRQIFAELADVDPARISKRTSLYRIGLDSLNAVQVASQMRSSGMEVDAADVMQHQHPEALAAFLASRTNEPKAEVGQEFNLENFDSDHRQGILDSLGIAEDSLEAIRPCTAAQSGMLSQFIQSAGEHYLNHTVYEVPSEYSFEHIRSAWMTVQRKHQVLRMGFAQLDEIAVPFAMVIYQPGSFLETSVTSPEPCDRSEIQRQASHEILHALHVPAWRVAVMELQGTRQMCLSMHHALYDAESLQILLTDFAAALHSADVGTATTIDQTLRTQIEGAMYRQDDSEAFWRSTLQSAHLVKFPNLTPNIVRESGSSVVGMPCSLEASELNACCSRKGVTVQAVGQTAWGRLLSAYTGESDVTFGTVFSGISASTANPEAFPSISTVPVQFSSGKPLDEALNNMVSYNASAQRHRFTPLSEIQRFAESAGQPLFDTVFIYQKSQNHSKDSLEWPVLYQTLGIDYVASLEMELTGPEEISLRLHFDTRIIPEAHAHLMLRQFDSILSHVAGDESDKINLNHDLLSISPPRERNLPSPVGLLHQFLERTAEQTPHKPALEFITSFDNESKGRKKWTYQDVNDRSNQVAQLISQHNVRPGGVVAVCMSKSAEATFAFAGILKAGCAFLAMDPDLPLARRKFIIEDSGSQLLFVDPGRSDPEMQSVVDQVELTEQHILEYTSQALSLPPADPQSTCYILYTSGTTGTPKGCELTHDNAVQAMMAFQRLFADHWTETSRWLQFASYWFDVSVLEQFWSWSVGITVVGAPRDLVLEDLAGFINGAGITHIDLTPSLARLVKPEEVPTLHNHVFITGGESLKQEIIDAWGPLNTIYNGYGPTEATIGVTMNPHIGPDAKPSNIGPPFDNVGAFVFAPGTDEPVLRGAVGELCVSGRLVGKGYLNRPDLTDKAFPYLERHKERVYRTGDLVRLLADGSISFIGRQDSQAKLRGQRLEIDEVDAVIKQSAEGISDVASLVAKSNEGNREMLVSFIVDRKSHHRETHLVQSDGSRQLVLLADSACRGHLPGYMVPTHIIPISRLPLTVNNKVDAKVLVALFKDMSNKDLQMLKVQQGESRKMSTAEKRIAKVLCKLLSVNMDDIRPDSNLFSLGLSSVSAINFASLLKRSGFSRATVASVMQNTTVDRLATSLANEQDADKSNVNAIKQAQLSISAYGRRHLGFVAQALSLRVSRIQSLYPCTPLQEGLLMESTKSSDRPYFNEFWFDVSELDLARLEGAIRRMHSLIPILRVSFVRTDEGYSQVVDAEQECPLEFVTLEQKETDAFVAKRKAEWQSQVDDHVSKPFQALLIKTASKACLIFFAHHALYDGVSWEVMLGKLQETYSTGQDVDCGPSFFEALPFGPLCSAQSDAKLFWNEHLDGIDFQPLERSAEDSADGGSSTSVRFDHAQKLEATRRKLGVSHQALFQAAFAVALHQFAPQVQAYGLVLSGRSIGVDRADEIIGPLFNTVPFGLNIHPDDTWYQYLQRCHASNADMLPFQHTSLRDIRKLSNRQSSDPLFDTVFVFQQPSVIKSTPSGMTLKPIQKDSPPEFGLAVEVEMDPSGEASVTIAAQKDIATEAAITQLGCDFDKALRCIMESSGSQISDAFNVTRAKHKLSSRKAPEPDTAQRSDRKFVWTAEARTVQEAIAQVADCDVDTVTEHSAIFTLGLDSIDAVKLASRLKRAGVSLPVSKILQAQTVANMMEAIDSHAGESQTAIQASQLSDQEKQLQSLREAFDSSLDNSVERILPVPPGQEALVADMLRSELHQYYNSDVLKLREDVDETRLQRAWQTVVDAYPILRTSFIEVANPDLDAVFAQLVHRPAPLEFAEFRAGQLSEIGDYVEKTRREVLKSYSRRSPLRLCIATISTERYLVLSLAHAQYDGHSLGLLHQDVLQAYHHNFEARPPYDNLINQALDATGPAALDFWRGTLTGARTARFCDASNVGESAATSHRVECTSSISVADTRSLCQKLGISLPAFAQASWGALLANHVQEMDVIFGVVLACRDSEEAENVMFPTMNTVPMRMSLHGSGEEMLRDMQNAINQAGPFKRTPLRAIQAACAGTVSHQTADNALIDTLFIYQQGPEATEGDPATLYESVDANSNVEFPVAVEVEVVNEQFIIRAACKNYALNEEDAKTLLERYDDILKFFAYTSDRAMVEFSGREVSICGLAPFEQSTGLSTSHSVKDELTDSEDEPDENASLTGTICNAMAQVSRTPVEEISSNATIESIGIDSISAIKVTALLRKLDVKISVSDMLKAQTARRMAEVARTTSDVPVTNEDTASKSVAGALEHLDLVAIQQKAKVRNDDLETVLPATAGQLYMLAMWRRTNGQLFYPTFRYHLKTTVSADELSSAWEGIVKRNPTLRTVLCSTGDKTMPVVQFVLRHNPSPENDTHRQPLVNVRLTSANDGYDIELKIHHALYDAVSLPILMQELQDHLAGHGCEDSTVKFEDFIALSVRPSARQSRKDFWTDYVRDVHPHRLPQSKGISNRKVEIFKPNILSPGADLDRCARTTQVTVQAILFASYARIYARHGVQESAGEDVVLGIYIANRAHLPDLDRLTSPTLNLVPLVVRSPLETDLLSSAKKIDRDLRLIGAVENATVSLADVLDWSHGAIKIDSFVNFLRLPANEEGVQSEEVLVQTSNGWEAGVSRVTEPAEDDKSSVPEELETLEPGEAYGHALDIELSQQGDALAMGLFCREDMVSLEEGESLVEELAAEIEEILK